jgi:NAD(P)H-binding
MRVCVVGASGKLGQYMVQHALDRGYEPVGVCRSESVGKLDAFKGRITVVPGATDDREVIKRAVAGCDGVLVVLVPRGVHGYASGTAQAVLHHARPGARLVFSCGWHITRHGQDVYSLRLKMLVKIGGGLARLARVADLDDQVEACRRVFASDTLWTVVRGSDLGEGESQGLPVWSRHVGDRILKSNITRRVGLRPVHGGGARERRARPRGPGDCAARRPRRSPTPPGNESSARGGGVARRDASPRDNPLSGDSRGQRAAVSAEYPNHDEAGLTGGRAEGPPPRQSRASVLAAWLLAAGPIQKSQTKAAALPDPRISGYIVG